MKKIFTIVLLFAFTTAATPFNFTDEPKNVRLAPPAPRFTDAERQAELARRRAAVEARMADKSVMVLFSAEPKLYTNDVDYVFRQENNLYYLTNLKQTNAALVIRKDGASVTETVYLPKRDPQYETWEGRMYSNEDAANISGIKNVVDAKQLAAYLQTLKDKSASSVESIYLLLPEGEADENGRREFRVENEFSKQVSGYKVVNAQPIFADLRHIKSPYEIKLLQHAIDITTEAQMRSMATVGKAKNGV
ncbi:MAG: aminopeptidase P N-terminal domain-containing protein [Pyrinomonadaceae bacterium]